MPGAFGMALCTLIFDKLSRAGLGLYFFLVRDSQFGPVLELKVHL